MAKRGRPPKDAGNRIELEDNAPGKKFDRSKPYAEIHALDGDGFLQDDVFFSKEEVRRQEKKG